MVATGLRIVDNSPFLYRPDGDWLASIARSAAEETGVPAELLGGYLTLLADAALRGHRLQRHELGDVHMLGRQAAERGVNASRVVDLFLSAAWRLWSSLPTDVRSRSRDDVSMAAAAVLRVVGDAVAVLVEGHQTERRHMIRREESLRREVIDDLLRGDSDVARMVERAEPFGLDLGRPHSLVLAAPGKRLPDCGAAAALLERAVIDKFGDRGVVVADKDGQIVIMVPSQTTGIGGPIATNDVGEFVHSELLRVRKGDPWRVATGRAYPGAYGIARSYEEAREALSLSESLRLDASVVHARDLLVYRVLVRDQVAIVDLVHAVLGPLTKARGGAAPLLLTLQTYLDSGGVATETARRLHMSVRTVAYRLAKIVTLTGHDPNDPDQRLALHVAAVGARLLGWPDNEPSSGT
jgi:sugar diacid utilization regulator